MARSQPQARYLRQQDFETRLVLPRIDLEAISAYLRLSQIRHHIPSVKLSMTQPSPFPGMDPYLEADMWPDVHHNLASEIQDAIAPQIAPKYITKVEPSVIKDRSAQQDIGIMYPDVGVFDRTKPELLSGKAKSLVTPATLSLPRVMEWEVRLPTIYIYDRRQQQLITAIEILSPVNKRDPQLSDYRRKRQDMVEAGVHLLEIDLIRRGQPPLQHAQLPVCDYRIVLERSDQARTDIWALDLTDALPVLPVPLAPGDAEAAFDLGHILHTLYQRKMYALSLDYQSDPPPPAMSPEKLAWVKAKV